MESLKQEIKRLQNYLRTKGFPYRGAERAAWIAANLKPLKAALKK